MRLINAKTELFEVFNDETKLPPYAILSHRWIDGEEIVYKDFLKGRNRDLSGWTKIDRCCAQALQDGIMYVWVDTCCIDKTSSAELSEAINSMYRWYGASTVCYAHLNDVHRDQNLDQSFVKSTWFTRSWTLQEMLAPTSLKFYDADWHFIGEKSTLSEELAEASGIHLSVFTSAQLNLSDWSVAQRMSWASRRKATRVEDIAYSLLGVFDVNMPLLYGEGSKAFRRLQEEIVRSRYDHTIFAWSSNFENSNGLLARFPASFANDANTVMHNFRDEKAYAITNIGLSIELPLELWLPRVYWAGLNATGNSIDQIGIWLLEDETRKGTYQKITMPCSFSKRDQSEPSFSVTTSRPSLERRCSLKQTNILLEAGLPGVIPRLGSQVLTGVSFTEETQLYTETAFTSFAFSKFEFLDFDSSRSGLYAYRSDNVEHDIATGKYLLPWGIDFRRSSGTLGVFPIFGATQASTSRPCTGILFDVLFGSLSRCVRIFRVGFNVEMCPVFLLADQPCDGAGGIKIPGRDATPIWQFDGRETESFQGPAKYPGQWMKSISPGLWAFKATKVPISSFYINLVSNPRRFVEIHVEEQRRDRFMYSISFSEKEH